MHPAGVDATVDAVVVGAGVVGLACARTLAQGGRSVVVLESAETFGTQTSSRNSEVVHAGLYYPPGSAKARLCVAGRSALYAYCDARGVGVRRCGKLVVASGADQEGLLMQVARRAAANGVDDVTWLSRAQARALEPQVGGTAALLSPSTGIVDSHGLMRALLADAQAAGARLVLRTPFDRAVATSTGLDVVTEGADPAVVRTRVLVNAAGLWASKVAAQVEGLPTEQVPVTYLARGVYAALRGRAPFTHLVYPVPEPGGLGVHLTLDLAGRARFGPDVEWVDAVDYTVDPARVAGFAPRIRAYWPGLPEGALEPAYAGIRPRLADPGEPDRDFVVAGPRGHGVPGLVNLFGIDSPGLTACLALADEVVATVEGSG